MRRVRIIDEPDNTYPYAAIDRQTGEIRSDTMTAQS